MHELCVLVKLPWAGYCDLQSEPIQIGQSALRSHQEQQRLTALVYQGTQSYVCAQGTVNKKLTEYVPSILGSLNFSIDAAIDRAK